MKFLFSALFLCAIATFLTGQSVRGKIIDSHHIPLPGAYIIHHPTQQHTHSNENGYFTLTGLRQGDTLEITHLGHHTAEVIVKDLAAILEIELREAIFQLNEVVVGQNIKAINLISSIDLRTAPVNSSQEVLRKIPGLFIGQHAGGGKAEQIFLRGFDIDHGTDIAITVDGMPVNMVSHAHGQGYADLHFLIPETIDKIDFGKGPYYADAGNFATAGYVHFKTKERLPNSTVDLGVGQFNTFRTVALIDLLQSETHNAYLASEYLSSDGPFDSPQNFKRVNLMAKYTGQLTNQNKFSFLASHFSSQWDASGQIPQRAVDAGLISRFGAIDDTEGGQTTRTNLAFHLNRNVDERTFLKSSIYFTQYDFELYSNFTFFLNDPVNGDQIRQKEQRQVFGMESEWNHSFDWQSTAALIQAGVGFRYDAIAGNELSRTKARRQTLTQLQLGDVDESNVFGFLNFEFDFGDWLVSPALRLDFFEFQYVNNLDTLFRRQTRSSFFASPKLNIVYNYQQNIQLFLKSGMGFHSNDARVVLDSEGEAILPAAYGLDLGVIWKPLPRLVSNLALWYLFLEQEFVYVGDEGVVEPSGRSRRLGVDLGLRCQLTDWLFADGDLNYAFARSVDEPEGLQYIPLAPDLTVTGGLNVKTGDLSGGITFRYLRDRPANENNTILAEGYFIMDLNAEYEWKNLCLGFTIENLLDQEWNETQFATAIRLPLEPAETEEIHFTPGSPFFLRSRLKYAF